MKTVEDLIKEYINNIAIINNSKNFVYIKNNVIKETKQIFGVKEINYYELYPNKYIVDIHRDKYKPPTLKIYNTHKKIIFEKELRTYKINKKRKPIIRNINEVDIFVGSIRLNVESINKSPHKRHIKRILIELMNSHRKELPTF